MPPAGSSQTKKEEAGEKPKFKRSRDRCHIINMLPVFDQQGNVLCYAFQYTAGAKFEAEALEPKHVSHVLIGYYVRRAMNIFVGDRGSSMVRLPLSTDSSRFLGLINTQRFIHYLPRKQEVSPSTLHLVDVMRKARMRIACDVYTVIYTRWAQAVKNFTYIVVDMEGDVNEQMNLAVNIREVAPWLKLIARCKNVTNCRDAFALGIDYVCAPDFPPETLLNLVQRRYALAFPEMFAEVCTVLLSQLSLQADNEAFVELSSRYPQVMAFFKPVMEILREDELHEGDEELAIGTYENACIMYAPETMRTAEAILCLKLLSTRFEPDDVRNAGLNSFEPLKFALDEGRSWYCVVEDRSLKETMPLFTLGILRTLAHFSASSEELEDPVYLEVMDKREKLISRFKALKSVSNGMEALVRTDLEELAKLAKDGFYSTGSFCGSIEKGLIWTQRIIKALGGNAEVSR
ncbi:MAG: hypothetical protein PUI29_08665 [Aeromonadales bacterium]|nr:hypothetical protein [Aeromonadales bacterium]MDY2889972.1 hypothetical protein [Succinivibrio sp.]